MSSDIDLEIRVSNCTDESPREVENYMSLTVLQDSDSLCYDDLITTGVGSRNAASYSIFDALTPPLVLGFSGYRIDEGTPVIFRNNTPLEIGAVYFFFISSAGSRANCRYDIQILEGSTAVPVLESPFFSGPAELCLGEEASYSLLGDSIPITRYVYTLDGDTVSRSSVFTQLWNSPGSYELCLSASNYCSAPAPSCRNIQVFSPDLVMVEDYICEGGSYEILADSFVYIAGDYELRLSDSQGCDSIVQLRLLEIPKDTQYIDVTLCLGDTLRLGGNRYFAAGVYDFLRSNQRGCDSTIIVNLDYTVCNLLHESYVVDPLCFGEASGSIRWQILDGTPPYRYEMRRLGSNQPPISGNIATTASFTTISGLAAGDYIVSTQDVFGNRKIFQATLENPAPLENAFMTDNLIGNSVACPNDANGSLSLQISGGQPPYTAFWNNGATAFSLFDLGATSYSVRIQDANGCLLSDSFRIVQPAAFSLALVVNQESCDPAGGDGSLELLSVAGGTAPYTFDLCNLSGQSIGNWGALQSGRYVFKLRDNRSCLFTDTITVTAPLRPNVRLLASAETVSLGEHIRLQAQASQADSLVWDIPGSYDFCAVCLQQNLLPLQSGYFGVQAFSPDGCVVRDSVYVQVIPNRKRFFPTAFSPNYDGVNDYFFPQTGSNVLEIVSLEVFDRWGGMVYQTQTPIPPNEISAGWDGSYRSKMAESAVYIWKAQVRFLDGELLPFQGSVVLIR